MSSCDSRFPCAKFLDKNEIFRSLQRNLVIAVIELFESEAFFRLFVPPSMKSIDNEVILVTGGAGGIGREICRRIVESCEKVKLVVWDVDEQNLLRLSQELTSLRKSENIEIYTFLVDISTRENIEIGCDKMIKETGPATVIINNAGIGPKGHFLTLSNEIIDKTLQINSLSHLWIIRKFLPSMIANNHGHIVNICSFGGLQTSMSHALPYFMSKFAVHGASESLKLELHLLGYDGIRVTIVYPYFIQTPLLGDVQMKPGLVMKLLLGPFKNILTPEKVSRKILIGIRRNYENIYLPKAIPFYVWLNHLLPLKVRRFVDTVFNDQLTSKSAVPQSNNLTSVHVCHGDSGSEKPIEGN